VLVVGSGCTPVRGQDFGTATARAKLRPSEVLLDTGRRYGVVASGIGVTIRSEPDPSASQVGTLRFTQIVATNGEASGADGQVWRQISTGGWVPRDGLLVFNTLREALNLVVELRVFSGPEIRRPGGPGAARPLLPTPTRPTGPRPAGVASPSPTPTKPAAPSPTPSRTPTPLPVPSAIASAGPTAPEPLYGVVLRGGTRQYARPGARPADRPTLEAGAAVAVLEEAVGPDGQRYLRTDEDVWVPTDAVRVFASLPEVTEFGYRQTLEGLAPGADVDPSVQPALWLVHREPAFRYLADAIGQYKVVVRVAPLAEGLIGAYSFPDRSITISNQYVDGDERVVAVALAHEATHAWEAGQGLRINTVADCFEAELRAFRNQAALWERFYGPNGKERPANQAEADQNEVLRLIKQDPEALKSRLVGRYADECGYQGALPAVATPGPGGTASTSSPAKPASSASATATPLAKPGGTVPAGAKPGGP